MRTHMHHLTVATVAVLIALATPAAAPESGATLPLAMENTETGEWSFFRFKGDSCYTIPLTHGDDEVMRLGGGPPPPAPTRDALPSGVVLAGQLALEESQSQRRDLTRIQTLLLGGTSLSASVSRNTIQDQAESPDSLTVKEIPPTWDTEDTWPSRPAWYHHRALRLPAKVGAGLGVGVVIGGMAMGYAQSQVGGSPRDNYTAIGLALGGAIFGCTVGFPFGVSAVDPHDSLLVTMLGGVIPGFTGYFLLKTGQGIGFPTMYIGPLIGSIVASELSRKPPEDRRLSFGLSPTLDGGLSASTTLRFEP